MRQASYPDGYGAIFMPLFTYVRLPDTNERSMADAYTEKTRAGSTASVNPWFSEATSIRKSGGLQMRITYEFVTGEIIQIEVGDEWGRILIELDEKDKSSNRKESRRHESLDTGVESEWVRDKAPSPDDIVADDDAKERILRKAAKILTAKQLDAFQKICIERMTEKEYAKRVGISQPVTHRRVVAAKNKMKKFLK